MMRPAPRRGVPRKSGYPDDMNNMRAIITRTIIVASVALYAIVAVPDLTFAAPDCNLKRDLENADLSGCNLTGANLGGANLTGANLIGANLTGANLIGADMIGANLWRADLTDADFTNADLENAFIRPGISRADMEGATGLDTVKGLVD